MRFNVQSSWIVLHSFWRHKLELQSKCCVFKVCQYIWPARFWCDCDTLMPRNICNSQWSYNQILCVHFYWINMVQSIMFDSPFSFMLSFNTVWYEVAWKKAVQILIRWRLMKLSDLDLHYFLMRIYPVSVGEGLKVDQWSKLSVSIYTVLFKKPFQQGIQMWNRKNIDRPCSSKVVTAVKVCCTHMCNTSTGPKVMPRSTSPEQRDSPFSKSLWGHFSTQPETIATVLRWCAMKSTC